MVDIRVEGNRQSTERRESRASKETLDDERERENESRARKEGILCAMQRRGKWGICFKSQQNALDSLGRQIPENPNNLQNDARAARLRTVNPPAPPQRLTEPRSSACPGNACEDQHPSNQSAPFPHSGRCF